MRMNRTPTLPTACGSLPPVGAAAPAARQSRFRGPGLAGKSPILAEGLNARTEHFWQERRPVDLGRAEQFEAIVIDGDGKGSRFMLRDAPSQQIGQPQVHRTAGEGVQEQVPAFARREHFGQQRIRRW